MQLLGSFRSITQLYQIPFADFSYYCYNRLLQAGCSKVYITSRKTVACEDAVAALNALPNKRPGAQAISVPADSSRMNELDRLVAEVRKTTDHVDILFANAGASWGEKFDTHPEAAFSRVMDLNVKSVFYTIQKYVTNHY
jgi:NAD(P)-dependent dehydrogenase (short-subunit alcohol dehydrogenase family)